MNKDKRTAIFTRLRDANPAPTTELNYRTPFELLIAVMLSAQATDVSVNKATGPLFAVANTPQQILDLGLDRLKPFVRSIGLYNTKAQNILKTCALLLDRHGGEVPQDRAALEALPGFRVANRTRIATGKTVRAVEDRLERLVPEPFRRDAHHWLILHGRYVCMARRPRCGSCLIEDLCEYRHKTEPD